MSTPEGTSDRARTIPADAHQRSASRVINAPAADIFAVLISPERHNEFDGSGTVGTVIGDDHKLTLGSQFGMKMQLGPLPYAMRNTVVEFEPNRLIAWRHYGRHRWRYELEPIDESSTKVTETFDWSTVPSPMRIVLQAVGYPERNLRSIEATLNRLAAVVEPSDTESAGGGHQDSGAS